MATLANFREFAREHLDLSVEELPNSLLDSFIKDASIQIDSYARNWEFQAGKWLLLTVIGQMEYAEDDLEDQSDTGTFVPQKIAVVYDGDGNILKYTGRAVSAKGRANGKPTGWSDWGSTVNILPIPAAQYELEVYGFRKTAEWIPASPTGNEVSPYPQEFDEVIRQWTIGRAYAQQEEGATATSFYDLANYNLNQLKMRYQSMNPIQSLRMNMGGVDTSEGLG